MIELKHVLITGASSGIGRQFAVQLAKDYPRQTLVGRNLLELQKTRDLVLEINSNAKVTLIQCDLIFFSEREALIEKISSPLHFVILAAGGGPFGKFIDVPLREHLDTIELNVSANVHLCRMLIPLLLSTARDENINSRLILVSSHAAFFRVPHFASYASSKSLILQFGESLALELKDEPIKIQILCPGATATRFASNAKIPKMVSTPVSADLVVSFSISNRQVVQIPQIMDRCIRLFGRWGSKRLLDRIVVRTQQRYLARKV
jgi:short-subunit dehydrogenase